MNISITFLQKLIFWSECTGQSCRPRMVGPVLNFAEKRILHRGRLTFLNFCLIFFYIEQNMELGCQKLIFWQAVAIDLYYKKMGPKFKKRKRSKRRVWFSETFKTIFDNFCKIFWPAPSPQDFFLFYFIFPF